MTLSFPADPAAQTPANTYSPTSTPESTDNGVTYVWNGTLWDASSESISSLWTRDGTTLEPANDGDDLRVGGESGVFIGGSDPGSAGFPNSINFGPFAPDPAEPWGHVGADTISVHSDIGSINVTPTDIADGGVQLLADGSITASGTISSQNLELADSNGTLYNSTGNLFIRSGTGGDIRFNTNGNTNPNANQVVFDAGGSAVFSNAVQIVPGYTSASALINTSSSSNRALILRAGANNGVRLSVDADSWVSASDERLKADLEPIENGLDKVSQLRSVTGRYKTDAEGTSRSFLIAQDVEKVLPEAVSIGDAEELQLSYTHVIPLLVSALHDAKDRIEALEAKLAALSGPSTTDIQEGN